ncbi:hypothetical protein KI387_031810 [Taxus chinensis]|uniref:O-fucosyltransferase family protein n=1 Tax=Taxus chinensis TaxID=29808 RepID=A0AA38F2Z9_TAXCH|nr:hypothetical protein KI387_031810 [Taxus chinensis]
MDKWKKNSSRRCKVKANTIRCLSLLLFLFVVSYYSVPRSTSSVALTAGELPQCITQYNYRPDSLKLLPKGEKYMWFAPHSGFSNQVSEFKNALLIARILNRTLIIPPIMDHHAVALGSCPKFRVQSALQLRSSVWAHITSLIQNTRYVSMADIIDFSGVISSSLVKLIDLRVFASLWCGLDIRSSCSGSLCHSLAGSIQAWGSFQKCGELLSGFIKNEPHCVYGVEEDCRTTVWTYNEEFDNTLDSFQPDENLRLRKKIHFSRKRRNIDKALGPGSIADHATVLLFGTLFTAPYRGSELYIDIHEAPKDELIGSLLEKIEYFPFNPEILNAGKEYAQKRIKEPFLCAQLRLLDGQFKNHWKTTFSALKDKLKDVQKQFQDKHKAVNIFLMTDLPATNWTGTYLGDLGADFRSYKLHVLNEKDDYIVNTARELMSREYGFRSGVPQQFLKRLSTDEKRSPRVLPDILLYIEETICSCASVGFVGTVGSTIADNIEQMRKHKVCSL